MKVICQKTDLITALTNVSGAISPSTMEVLEGFYLLTEPDNLFIAGYNLEVGISTRIFARIEKRGSIVLNASLLLNIIKKLPEDQVCIEVDDRNIARITSGEAEFSIVGIASDVFPELPSVTDGRTVTIKESILKTLVRQTRFAVAKTDSNPVHTGIMFELENGKVTAVAVDGYRLALATQELAWDEYTRFIVPEKGLAEIMKMLKDDGEEIVTIEIGRRNLMFEVGRYTYVTRLLDGDFLDYRAAIPASHTTTVTVNTRSVADLIDRISPVISDRLRSPVRCIFADSQIKASCSTAIGTASDRISAKIEGERVEIGFNNRFLLDALKACECDEIKIALGSSLSPMKILPVEGDSFLFLVLPVRLKTETI